MNPMPAFSSSAGAAVTGFVSSFASSCSLFSSVGSGVSSSSSSISEAWTSLSSPDDDVATANSSVLLYRHRRMTISMVPSILKWSALTPSGI